MMNVGVTKTGELDDTADPDDSNETSESEDCSQRLIQKIYVYLWGVDQKHLSNMEHGRFLFPYCSLMTHASCFPFTHS